MKSNKKVQFFLLLLNILSLGLSCKSSKYSNWKYNKTIFKL